MPEKKPDWMRERARELRAEGRTMVEIAAMFGVSKKTIWWWCNPEHAKEIDARSRDRNRENRRASDRARIDRLRKPCPVCGELMGKGSASQYRQTLMCPSCWTAEHERKLALVERLYKEGASQVEIARQLGWSETSNPGVLLDELRRQGRIGYRYKGCEHRRAA